MVGDEVEAVTLMTQQTIIAQWVQFGIYTYEYSRTYRRICREFLFEK